MDGAVRLAAPMLVELRGEKGAWRARYAGADGTLGTPDDVVGGQDVHLPTNTPVRLELRSNDAIYFFSVPALGLNESAIPKLTFSLVFTTGRPGTFELRQDGMCGAAHPNLKGQLVVESPDAFEAWFRRQASAGGSNLPSLPPSRS